LTIVLDHLAKPDIANKGWEPWASLVKEVAARPNVSVKLSGLNTASAPDWTWQDWLPYVDHAIEHFGSARVMLGSDWPVSILAGDFGGVWLAQREVIAHLSVEQQDDILFRTAIRAYSLDVS
ncbi:MAG: amidohydrolase family protein, partial [Salinibacterium sp.]|nr:amidohydrolase family protein [Salinibacterium sp.]